MWQALLALCHRHKIRTLLGEKTYLPRDEFTKLLGLVEREWP